MTGDRYNKILLIGIDGTDPDIMKKLMDEGHLPNFVRLKDSGSFLSLETNLPAESPSAWASIATGTNPGKHNIFGFIGRNPKNYLPYLAILKQKGGLTGTKYEPPIQGTPFWKITSDAGIPTTIIRWPVTFPPDKVEGRMFSGMGVPDITGFLGKYHIYTSGDFDRGSEGAEKIIEVENRGGVIETKLFGPIVGKKREQVEVPMQIRVNGDDAIVSIQGSDYQVHSGEWSEWIRIKFKVGLMREVSGIARVHLNSTEPFYMYLTSIQVDPISPLVDITYPKEYSSELVDSIGLYNTLGMPEDTKALTEERMDDDVFLEQCTQIEDERNKMFWHEFDRFTEGVFAFAFDTSDRIMHNFWEGKNDSAGELVINDAVREYYIEKDKFLGEVLDRLDDKTALIIFSDHGFTDFDRGVSINTWLSENGYMSLTQNPDEKHSGELFEFVNWSGTDAYSLGFAGIYINLKGREGSGIVEKKEKVVNEIIEKLKKLTDPKTGKRAITRLYRSEDVYQGQFVKNAPDIIIGFSPGYRMAWQNAIGGMTPEVFSDNQKKWDGDHIVDPSHVPGVLFTNFKIKNENPHQMDIAPTVLSMLGLRVPEDMDGKALE
ncbi:MAG: alkaline phosphatase family protein [Candidatus Hydrothermarchaeaceae archaeon]